MNKAISVLLVMAVQLLWVPSTFAADAPKSVEASTRAQRRTERERQFLYRAVEDLNRSQEYVQAAVRGLEKMLHAVDSLEPSRRERDIGSLLEWYRSYAEWLGSNLADIEADLSRSYSEKPAAIVQPERFSLLVDGYSLLEKQLGEQLSRLETLNDRTSAQISRLRTALEYVTSVAFIEERNREKKQTPQGNDRGSDRRRDDRQRDDRYERYKDITDIEIAMMQREVKDLDELQKNLLVLLELGRMELSWMSRKAGDYDALGRFANVVGRDSPGPIEEAGNGVVKQYDSDIVYFKRKIDDLSRARSRIVPSGTLRTLDRMEELSANYDAMKSRYERHLAWLAEQVGAYRADSVVLLRDK